MNRSEAEAATAFVLAYLGARHEWERAAYRENERAKTRGTLDETMPRIRASYEQLLRRFCSPLVLQRRPQPSFGDPPEVDLDRTIVRSVELRGRRIVVTTEEEIEPFPPTVHEYVLDRTAGGFLLVDRRARGSSGSWIRYVI